MNHRHTLALLTALCMVSETRGHEFTTQISIEAERSDNVLQQPSGLEQSELTLRPTASINYLLNFTQVTANLDYQAQQVTYRDNTSDDRLDLTGSGSMQWQIIDQRLSWMASHTSTRQTINSLDADIPANQVDRSVFQTGPVLQYTFGGVNTLQVGANWSDNDFDDEALADATQSSINLQYSRAVNPLLQVGLSGSYSETDVEVFKYSSQQLQLTLSSTRKFFDLSMSIGPSRSEREDLPPTDSVAYSLSISGTTTFGDWAFNASQQQTDTTNGLSLGGQFNPGNNGDTNFSQTDLVERTRVEFTYTRQIIPRRLNASFNLSQDEQNQDADVPNEKNLNAGVSLQYTIGQRTSASLQTNWRRTKPEDGSDESNNRDSSLNLNFRMNNKMAYSMFVNQNKRSGGLTAKYTELSVGVRASFTL
jgi:hypothetical protein